MIVHVLILCGVIAAAAALAVVVHRSRAPDAEASPEYGSALSFVGAAYGLLLGLLVVFAVGHLNDVRTESQQEATSLVALDGMLDAYPPQTRDRVRHDLVCYMRSIIQDEWPSMERGRQLEAPRTLGLGDGLRADVRNLPASGPGQAAAYGHAVTLTSDAGGSRQRLLFMTAPRIPTALWVVIYVGAFVVFLLLAVHYAPRPPGRVLVLASAGMLMIVVVGVLAMLDQPFGVGVRVRPDQMRHAVSLVLVSETSPTVLRPCA